MDYSVLSNIWSFIQNNLTIWILPLLSGFIGSVIMFVIQNKYNKKRDLKRLKWEVADNLFAYRYQIISLSDIIYNYVRQLNAINAVANPTDEPINIEMNHYEKLKLELEKKYNSSEIQSALGRIPIVFADNKKVIDIYKEYVQGKAPKESTEKNFQNNHNQLWFKDSPEILPTQIKPENDPFYRLIKEICEDKDIKINTDDWDPDLIMKPLHL